MRGFTIFDIIIVLLIITIVAIVAIPDALSRITAREENRVFALMDRLAVAQQRFRQSRQRDTDADDRGEFGFMEDLSAGGPGGRPWLELDSAENAGDYWRVGTYRVAILLPDGNGIPVPPSSAATVDPEAASLTFLAIAWPDRAGQSARRAYAVNQDLIVREHRNETQAFSGGVLPTFPALAVLDPNARRFIPTPFWTSEWDELLPDAQIPRRRSQLEEFGLPVPVDLDDRE